MAKLADASDLGSDGKPYGFESLRLHQTRIIRTKKTIRGSYYFLQEISSAPLSAWISTSEFASFGRLRFA